MIQLSRKMVLVLIFSVVMVVFITGIFHIASHKKKMETLSSFFSDIVSQNTNVEKTLPDLQLKNIGQYNVKRNPFMFVEQPIKKQSQTVIKSVLMAYPLRVLKLIGVVTFGNIKEGIVQAPDGKVYRVKVGTKIGQSNGYVTDITNQQIDVIEKISVGGGKWLDNKVTLKLQKTAT